MITTIPEDLPATMDAASITPAVYRMPAYHTKEERMQEDIRYFFSDTLRMLLSRGDDAKQALDVTLELIAEYKKLY